MGSIIGHEIDYNGEGVLTERPAEHTQQKLTQVPPRALSEVEIKMRFN